MSINVTPIPRLTSFGAPSFTLGLTNSAGDSDIAVASNSTLLAFDATVPSTIASGASAATGSATVTARRDHTHGAYTATAAASEAEELAGSSTTAFTSPGRQQFHPSAAKVWGKGAGDGTLAAPSYNIYSFGKDSTGVYTWTWADDFSDVDYALVITPYDATAFFNPDTIAVGSVKVRMFDTSSTYADRGHSVAGFGEQ